MKKVVIDRAAWDRGKSSRNMLRTEDGKMCCLGFVCKALGATDEEMLGRAMPSSIEQDTQRFLALTKLFDAELDADRISNHQAVEAARFNDSSSLDEPTREKLVTNTLAEVGFEIEFVGEDQ